MLQPSHAIETCFPPQPQLPPHLGDLWETEVVPQLPADLDEQVHELKALQRMREIDRASDLLRALLARVLGRWSFRQLGCWAVILGVADISEAAWRKRVRLCGDWLHWLLTKLLAVFPKLHFNLSFASRSFRLRCKRSNIGQCRMEGNL
jgi:hypothetical protein